MEHSGWEGFMCHSGAHLLPSFKMKSILFVYSVLLLCLVSYNAADLIVKFALKTTQKTTSLTQNSVLM